MMKSVLVLIKDKLNHDEKEVSISNKTYQISRSHHLRNIEKNEYILMGMAFIRSLKYCLINEFNMELHSAWLNVFSVMLQELLPFAVSLEFIHGLNGLTIKTNCSHSDKTSKSLSTCNSTVSSHIYLNPVTSTSSGKIIQTDSMDLELPAVEDVFGKASNVDYIMEDSF